MTRMHGLLTVVVISTLVCVVVARGAVEEKVKYVARPFDLADVQLLNGPFKHAADLHGKYLLDLEADRLLAGFREDAGLTPRAPKYGGWESQGVAGHTLGHHLSACALAYRSTGDERFRERVEYVVRELAECQRANGEGYVAAIPQGKRIFAEVSRGDIRSKGFDLNGGWVPWYTMHKLFAGLRDAHQLCGSEQAKEVLIGLGDWALKLTDGLSEEQIQRMLACEHGGMNESGADLYAMTGDEKYLKLADRFNHRAVLEPLANRQDRLQGLHANTQVPKLIGAARQYELRGDERFRTMAEFFWKTVVENHSYVNGGNSDHEHFGPPNVLSTRLSDNSSETCNTYNMLKLTRHLFTWTGDASYADYYERAVINHILASQHPESAGVTYYVPLRYGGKRIYQPLFDAFTCCVGTGQENHVKYGDSIYFHDGAGERLWVNLFIASELDWKQNGAKVRMESPYPHEGTVKLSFQLDQPRRFTLSLRRPRWAETFALKVNGSPHEVTSPAGSYVDVDREWRSGDRVEIDAPYPLRYEPQPDRASQVAILNGPLVLAGKIEEPAGLKTVLVTSSEELLRSIEPAVGPSRFRTDDVGRPKDLELLPFFEAHDVHYTVYFDLFTEAQWQTAEAEYRAQQERERDLAARTVDVMALGEMQPERDHELAGEKTRAGEHHNRKWRDAEAGGWFEFSLKVDPTAQNELVCTYWGGETFPRHFDVLVDGEVIATQKLHNNEPGRFFEVSYPVPRKLTDGKQSVRVRFQGRGNSLAGGCFGARMLREKTADR